MRPVSSPHAPHFHFLPDLRMRNFTYQFHGFPIVGGYSIYSRRTGSGGEARHDRRGADDREPSQTNGKANKDKPTKTSQKRRAKGNPQMNEENQQRDQRRMSGTYPAYPQPATGARQPGRSATTRDAATSARYDEYLRHAAQLHAQSHAQAQVVAAGVRGGYPAFTPVPAAVSPASLTPSATLAAAPRPQAAPMRQRQQPQQRLRPAAPRPQASGAGTAGWANARAGASATGGKPVTRLSKAQALAMAARLKQWIAVGALLTFTGMIGLVLTHPVISSSTSNTSSSTTPSSGTSSSSSSSSTSSSSSSSGGYFNSSGSVGSSGSSSNSPSTGTGVS